MHVPESIAASAAPTQRCVRRRRGPFVGAPEGAMAFVHLTVAIAAPAIRPRRCGLLERARHTSSRRDRKSGSRPISRVLSWAAIPLGPASPQGSSIQPGSDAGHVIAPLFGLAPGGVCRAGLLPDSRCALTAPFHPYHACLATSFGGLLSVALSVGLRRPGVTWHLALWSPDFPRHAKRDAAA